MIHLFVISLKRYTAALLVANIALLLSACASRNQPELEAAGLQAPVLPAAFEGAAIDTASLSVSNWWENFNDPALSQIVTQTLAQNLTWQAAQARAAQAQSLLAQSVASQSPQIDLGANVTRQRRSLEVSNTVNLPSAPRDSSLWGADAQLRWQWDAFDVLKLTQTAAGERVEQSRAAVAAARLLVASQAATVVVQIRALRQRIKLAQTALAIDRQQLEISLAKRRAGLTVQTPVLQAQVTVEASLQVLAVLDAEQIAYTNALAILASITPAEATKWLGDSSQLPLLPKQIEVGVPSQLLLRRPDLLEAQAQVRVASADLAASLSERYPQFNFNAQIGWAAASAAALGSPAALLAAISPSVSWPLLDGGTQVARADQRRAQVQEAALLYRQAVLRAFAQTQSALQTLALREREGAAATLAVSALNEAVQVTRTQHTSGQLDQVAALQAQRAVVTAQATQTLIQLQTLEAAINTYQAAGGGWGNIENVTTESDTLLKR